MGRWRNRVARARSLAEAPWRQRFSRAPPLFHEIRLKAQGCHVNAAIELLQNATDESVAELAASDIGVIADVIRAASTKGMARGEHFSHHFVDLALQRGLPPNTRSPGFAAWEQLSVPLVSAATATWPSSISYSNIVPIRQQWMLPIVTTRYTRRLRKPQTIGWLLSNTWLVAGQDVTNPHRAEFIRLVNSPNRYGKTPFIAALIADPQKAAHKQSAVDLARHAVLSDDDFLILHTQRKLARLQALILDHTTNPSQVPAATTRFWQPAWHWTFPASDRAVLNLLHAFSFRADSESPLPPELWAHVFSFVERGHFVLRGEEGDSAARLAAASERAEAVAAAEMPAAAAAAASSAAVALQ